jgi:type I restriction enzyme S subunit
MSNKWRKVRLGEIATITRGSSPRPIIEWVSATGTPWVKIADATSEPGRYISSTKECIKNEARSKSVVVNPGDLIVSNSATPGMPKFMKIEACIHDGWLLLRNFKEVLPEFLYYIFINDRKKLVAQGTGSVFTNLKTDILKNHQILLPSLEEQQWIAETLSEIDDLIQTNVSIAETLVEIAETIYKSWFIDFDPVKAKSAGEKPLGIDDATSALFPDSLEDSESGPIPMGWKLSQIGDEVECVGGSTPSTSNSEFWDGDIFWTTPKDLSRQIGLVTTSSERRITGKGLQRISSGVLPVNSVLMSSRAPIGYLSINAVPTAINQGFIALRKNSRFTPLFLLFWLKTNMAEIKNRAGGGTFAEISKNAFKSIPFVVPDEETMQKFDELAEPILRQLTALTLQNQELIEMRESLLPRLISGELQIPEDLLVS